MKILANIIVGTLVYLALFPIILFGGGKKRYRRNEHWERPNG
jgi:hypothetical protein